MIIQHSEEYDQYYAFVDRSESMQQHGVFGMRWGIRKYQNKDGSLTPAGKKHYGVGTKSNEEVIDKVARDRASAHKRTKNAAIWTLLFGPAAGALAAVLTKTEGSGYEKLVQEYKDDDEFRHLKETLENNTETVSEYEKDIQKLKDVGNSAKDSIKKTANEVLGEDNVQKLKDVGNSAKDSIKKTANDINNNVGVQTAKSEIKNIVNDVKDNFNNGMKSIDKQNDLEYRKKMENEYYEKLNEYQNKYFDDGSFDKMYKDLIENVKKENKGINLYEDDGYIYTGDDNNGKFIIKKFKYNGKEVDSVSAYDETIDKINKRFDIENAKDPSVKVMKQIQKENLAKQRTTQAQYLKSRGYTVEEIAKKLKIPVGTVNSYLYS